MVKFDIGLYILPADTRVEISIVDTSTVYSKADYQVSVLAQDGTSNDDVPGVYGPQTSEPLFYIITSVLALWVLGVIIISIVYSAKKRQRAKQARDKIAL